MRKYDYNCRQLIEVLILLRVRALILGSFFLLLTYCYIFEHKYFIFSVNDKCYNAVTLQSYVFFRNP